MSDPVALTSEQTHVIGDMGASQQLVFYIDVEQAGGAFLAVLTSGDSGDIDLYVKRGSIPTTSSYDQASTGPNTFEDCYVAAPSVDRYYILVLGFDPSTNVQVLAVVDTPNGNAFNAVDLTDFTQFGDPRNFVVSGGQLEAGPFLEDGGTYDTPLAAMPAVVTGEDLVGVEFQLVVMPPVYSGAQNTLSICATGDASFTPASEGATVPWTNVALKSDCAIQNPSSPAAGFPSSGSQGTLKLGTATKNWGSAQGLQQQTMLYIRGKVRKIRSMNFDGTYEHDLVLAITYSTTGMPGDFSNAAIVGIFPLLSVAELKAYAVFFTTRATHTAQSASNFDDPSAVDDPLAYYQSLKLAAVTAGSTPTPPPADPFWTNFVGCKEAA